MVHMWQSRDGIAQRSTGRLAQDLFIDDGPSGGLRKLARASDHSKTNALMHAHNSNRRMGGENCLPVSAAVAPDKILTSFLDDGMSSRVDVASIDTTSTSRPQTGCRLHVA